MQSSFNNKQFPQVPKLYEQDQRKLKQKKEKIIKNEYRVPFLINFMKLFKISDYLFQKLQKNKEIKLNTKLAADFYSKTIKKIQFKRDFTTLIFKKYKSKLKQISCYTQDLKHLNDSFLYDTAVFIQCIHAYDQQNQISCFRKKDIQDNSHYELLPQLLEKLKSKTFLLCFMEKVNDDLLMDRIFISKKLQQATGYSNEEIHKQYLQYGHVFFQIMTKQFYSKFSIELGHVIKQFIQKQKISQSEDGDKHKQFFLSFDDFIMVKQPPTSGKQIQEVKIKSKIEYYKPHHKISVFEFQIQERSNEERIYSQQDQQKQKIKTGIFQNQNQSLKGLIDLIKQCNIKKDE